jgi:hypothetical protein
MAGPHIDDVGLKGCGTIGSSVAGVTGGGTLGAWATSVAGGAAGMVGAASCAYTFADANNPTTNTNDVELRTGIGFPFKRRGDEAA